MLRVAMLSKWHAHAQGYANQLLSMDGVSIPCVWDEVAERGQSWADKLGVDFERDIDALLARSDVDAVLVDAPTSMHPELMVKAARAGKHIFTEKVMALTVEGCDEIARAVKKSGVQFGISFPQRCLGRNKYVKQVIDSGALGQITVMRVRNAHDGASGDWLPEYWYDPMTTGGGAMMDLGAHPMYLALWLLGRPLRVQSCFNHITRHAVEDNSVSTIEFACGAIAVSETSLVSPLAPNILEVYGTKGVILCCEGELRLRTLEMKQRGEDWLTPELPADDPSPLEQWVAAIENGTPHPYGLRAGRDLTELMVNAYKAHYSRREVAFENK